MLDIQDLQGTCIKHLARPELYSKLHGLVNYCHVYLMYSNNYHMRLISQGLGLKVPIIPFIKLTTDFFHLGNSSYLLIVNYYSRFPVLNTIDRMTTKYVSNHMDTISSEHGWHDTLFLARALPHTTSEKLWKIWESILLIVPYHPKSIRLANKNI